MSIVARKDYIGAKMVNIVEKRESTKKNGYKNIKKNFTCGLDGEYCGDEGEYCGEVGV